MINAIFAVLMQFFGSAYLRPFWYSCMAIVVLAFCCVLVKSFVVEGLKHV